MTYAKELVELCAVAAEQDITDKTPDFGAASDGDGDRNMIVGKGLCASASSSSAASPSSSSSSSWIELPHPPHPTERLPLLLALRHRHGGPEALAALVATLSDPTHPHYGRYLAAGDLTRYLTPRAHASTVVSWLESHGASTRLATSGDFVHANMTVAQAATAFGVERFGGSSTAANGSAFRAFTHSAVLDHRIIRAPYGTALPSHIAPYVELIRGLDDFPPTSRRRSRGRPSSPQSPQSSQQPPHSPQQGSVRGSQPCTFAAFSFPTSIAAGDGVLNATLSWACDGGGTDTLSSLSASTPPTPEQYVSHFLIVLTQSGKQVSCTAPMADCRCGTPNWAGGNPVCSVNAKVRGVLSLSHTLSLSHSLSRVSLSLFL